MPNKSIFPLLSRSNISDVKKSAIPVATRVALNVFPPLLSKSVRLPVIASILPPIIPNIPLLSFFFFDCGDFSKLNNFLSISSDSFSNFSYSFISPCSIARLISSSRSICLFIKSDFSCDTLPPTTLPFSLTVVSFSLSFSSSSSKLVLNNLSGETAGFASPFPFFFFFPNKPANPFASFSPNFFPAFITPAPKPIIAPTPEIAKPTVPPTKPPMREEIKPITPPPPPFVPPSPSLFPTTASCVFSPLALALACISSFCFLSSSSKALSFAASVSPFNILKSLDIISTFSLNSFKRLKLELDVF